MREFWENKDAFTAEILALRSAGIIHVHDHSTLIPEDLAPSIRQVLGLDMGRVNVRRLLATSRTPNCTAFWNASREDRRYERGPNRSTRDADDPGTRDVDHADQRAIARDLPRNRNGSLWVARGPRRKGGSTRSHQPRHPQGGGYSASTYRGASSLGRTPLRTVCLRSSEARIGGGPQRTRAAEIWLEVPTGADAMGIESV